MRSNPEVQNAIILALEQKKKWNVPRNLAEARALFCHRVGTADLKKIKELDLSKQQLANLLPQDFQGLLGLKFLDLSHNRLESIPDSLGDLANLRALFIAYNPNLSSIPPSIGKLAKLQQLSLPGNKLVSLPESIGNLAHLRMLDLKDNLLASLPKQVGNLTRLQVAYLMNNQLPALPEEVGNLAKLQILNLENNRLASLPDSMGNLSKLMILSLAGNQLVSLPESMGNLARLELLNLENNLLASLPESMGERYSKLLNIKVAGNPLSSESLERFFAKIRFASDHPSFLEKVVLKCGGGNSGTVH